MFREGRRENTKHCSAFVSWWRSNGQGQGNLLCFSKEKAKEKPSGLNGFRGGSPARLLLLLSIKVMRRILYVCLATLVHACSTSGGDQMGRLPS